MMRETYFYGHEPWVEGLYTVCDVAMNIAEAAGSLRGHMEDIDELGLNDAARASRLSVLVGDAIRALSDLAEDAFKNSGASGVIYNDGESAEFYQPAGRLNPGAHDA